MLARTLSGVFSQDAAPTSWHLTVVDNASTDNTRQILDDYSARHPNFDFIVNERNLGLFGNLNRCMSLARTKKYMIVHSDDDIDSALVSSVLGFLGRHPDVQMCFGASRARIEGTNEVVSHWYRSRIVGEEERVLQGNQLLSALMLSGSNFIFAPTVVYDKDFFSSELRYSSEFEYASDLDLWFRAALMLPKVGFIPEPLITCGIHGGRLSAKHADRMRLEAITIFRRYLTILRNRSDLKVVGTRFALLLETKLLVFELAIRLHLVPSFKLRRKIFAFLDMLGRRRRDSSIVG
jgi:glycosyltransferase involved in cell wall biosynthesis